MAQKEPSPYSNRKVIAERFLYTPIPRVSLEKADTGDRKKIPDPRTIRKRFVDTRVGRFLLGENKLGEIVHGVLDFVPTINIHEVIKRVIREADAQDIEADYLDVFIESFRRLDVTRTLVSVLGGALLILGSEWTGIEIEQLEPVVEWLLNLLGETNGTE